MKNIKILSVVFLLISILGCSMVQKENDNVTSILYEYYVDVGKISGFTGETKPYLYHTYWVTKTMKGINSPLKNTDDISASLQDINIFDKSTREQLGFGSVPIEYAVYIYVQMYKELQLDMPNEKKNEIIEFFLSRQDINGRFYNDKNKNQTLIAIKTLNSLKIDVPNKNKIIQDLKTEEYVEDISKIDYYYLLSHLGVSLSKSDVGELQSIKLQIENQNNLNYYIEKAYKLQFLNKKLQLKLNMDELFLKNSSISKNEIINTLLNFESIDPQLIYKYLYITQFNVSKGTKNNIKEFYESTYLKGGWKPATLTLDLRNTISGLEVLHYHGQLGKLNIEGINTYLESTFNSIRHKELNLMSSLELSHLSRGFQIVNNKLMLKEVDHYIQNKLSNMKKSDIDFITLSSIIEISNITKEDYLKHFDEHEKKNIIININSLANNIKSAEDIYWCYTIKKFLGTFDETDKETLLTFLNQLKKDNWFKNKIRDDHSMIEATYVLTKLIVSFEGLNVLDKAYFEQLKRQLVDKKNSLSEFGIIYQTLNMYLDWRR